MGALVRASVEADDAFELVGQVGIEDVDALDAGEVPVADLVIDFTNHAMLPHLAAYLKGNPAALVSGTTGFEAEDFAVLDELSERMPVMWSANYSLGVAVLRCLAAEAAKALEGFDIEIVETHHNQKVDAPSGTAKLLLSAVDPDGACNVVSGRDGMVGARTKREVGMHALRGGTVAGTHEVHFFGTDEEVCLTHRATSRQIFVNGAVAAAKRLAAQKPGRYSFEELML
ncbi:MAG: 4-hydroxy-tetrahydrodipicolinate reductase [Atopobiaceae bacterium]|nr:4-hydroxy-tetrahydrodipicolinate reductase [Atopobiaceae bacterium]